MVKPYYIEEKKAPKPSLYNNINREQCQEEQQALVHQSQGRPKGSRNKNLEIQMAFIANKEQADKELLLKLQKEGIITTLGLPFEASQKQEIEGLIRRGVFSFKLYNLIKHANTHIFKSRIINKIKGKTTNTLYEKSRLVI